PIEAGAGHLAQLESSGGAAHFSGERERYQHVDLGKLRDDPALPIHDDVAGHSQLGPHSLLEAGGEGSSKGNSKHDGIVRVDKRANQLPRRQLAGGRRPRILAGVKAGSRRQSKGPAASSVGTLIKQWREQRRMSQLDLAVEAEISSRHLSFLETG